MDRHGLLVRLMKASVYLKIMILSVTESDGYVLHLIMFIVRQWWKYVTIANNLKNIYSLLFLFQGYWIIGSFEHVSGHFWKYS